jgi:hypothetical protein
MIGLTWIEFFLRAIPESLLFTWCILVIAKHNFKLTKWILVSAVSSVSVFVIRKLPIYLGVHTIISTIAIICIMSVSGLEIIKSVYSTLLTFFLFTVSELLNVLILKFFNISINISSKDIEPTYKSLIGIPSLVFFLIIILIIINFTRKEDGVKYVSK